MKAWSVVIAAVTCLCAFDAPAPLNPASSAFDYLASSCTASGGSWQRQFTPVGLKASGSGASAGSEVDNTAPIQMAIDAAAAAGGGVVPLPKGTFVIDGHLILRDNVTLTGAGPDTVLKAGSGFLDTTGPQGGYPLLTTSGAVNVTIDDLTADQSGDTLDVNPSSGARLTAYLVDVRDSRNVIIAGVNTRNPFTYSIAVVDSSNFCVEDCETRVSAAVNYDQLDGIHILDSHGGQIIANDVDQRIGNGGDDGLAAHTIDSSVYDILFAGNKVRGGADGDGLQLAVGNYPMYNIAVRDNEFWGSPYGIRTGYYDTGTNGVVHNIEIEQNDIHDLVPGVAFPNGGDAVNIGGFGAIAPVFDVNVTMNVVCRAGIILVSPGAGNRSSPNLFC